MSGCRIRLLRKAILILTWHWWHALAGRTSEQALKGKVVGALASSTGEKWAKENQAKLGFSDYRSYPDYQGLLLDVQNGRLDAGVSDYLGLEYATANMNGVGVTHRIVTGDRYGDYDA